jgi:DNA-nicking Smr family endonuclease
MHKPFAALDQWVKDGRLGLSVPRPQTDVPDPYVCELPAGLPDVPDDELFEWAVKDVKALGWSAVPLQPRPPQEIQPQDDELDALRALEDFIRQGNIDIEQTAEYIEGTVQPLGRLYLQDLRSGRFSVQSHLDLHGMNQQEARFALDEFLMEAVRKGLSCVRVIHGRGRHSHKHHSVLKENIHRWLCSRRMSRKVIAYTSARRCDGGGGAVYILLRK